MTRYRDDQIQNLQREVERLFHDLVYRRRSSAHFGEPAWAPPADLVVTRSGARVILELAGVPRESVRVVIHGRTLEISGRREPPQEPEGAHYHQAEIFFGNFRRVVELPWEADEHSIRARYRDGMLEIQLKPVTAGQTAHLPMRGQR